MARFPHYCAESHWRGTRCRCRACSTFQQCWCDYVANRAPPGFFLRFQIWTRFGDRPHYFRTSLSLLLFVWCVLYQLFALYQSDQCLVGNTMRLKFLWLLWAILAPKHADELVLIVEIMQRYVMNELLRFWHAWNFFGLQHRWVLDFCTPTLSYFSVAVCSFSVFIHSKLRFPSPEIHLAKGQVNGFPV